MAGLVFYNLTDEQVILLSEIARDKRLKVEVPAAYSPLECIAPEGENVAHVQNIFLREAARGFFNLGLAKILDIPDLLTQIEEDPASFPSVYPELIEFIQDQFEKSGIKRDSPSPKAGESVAFIEDGSGGVKRVYLHEDGLLGWDSDDD